MKRVLLLSLGLLGVFLLGITTDALAVGTPAGTVITNTATLNYKDLAGTSFTAVQATATITVAQLAGVSLSPPTAAQTVGDSVYVYYPFTVTNTGNGTDKYDLTDPSNLAGWNPQIYVDANHNGVLDPSELSAGAVTVTDTIQEDSTKWYIERLFVPYHTVSGTIDTVKPKAASQFAADTVTSSGTYITTIAAAVVPLTKIASNPTPQPDQVETYTIGYHNTGTATADSLVITDVLSGNVTYVNGSASAGGTYNGGTRTITWSFAPSTLSGGASGNVTFQAKVNHGVPSGTVITNQANDTFIDSINQHHETGTSPPVDVTVSDFAKLAVTITPTPDTVDVGLVAKYEITLTNLGNYTDSESFAFLTTLHLGWIFYTDANGDSVIDGSDHLLNFSDVVGALPESSSVKFIAYDTIPHNTPDRSVDSLTVTFTSLVHGTIFADTTAILVVRAPLAQLLKSVIVVPGTGGPNTLPIPGATLEYTVTYKDTGTGGATSYVVTDPIPGHTTYVTGSVILNGTPITDVAAGNPDATHPVTVNIGPLASGGTGTIKFRVIIN